MIEISKPNWLLLSSSPLVTTVQEYYHSHCNNKANCHRHDDNRNNNQDGNENENDEENDDYSHRQDNDYTQHLPFINRTFKPVVCFKIILIQKIFYCRKGKEKKENILLGYLSNFFYLKLIIYKILTEK